MEQLPKALNAHNPERRKHALNQLVDSSPEHIQHLPVPRVNLHCHTIYSYNGYGYSPSALAWLARKQAWHALGTVDFDVLDGVEETLWACEQAGVRGVAGMETRTHVPERRDVEFNSPGEPGIMYTVGMGFISNHPAPDAQAVFDDLRARAENRNREMVALLNAFLVPVTLDYDQDVLPLTPSGNATERHLLIAYDAAARRHFPKREPLLTYWADKLEMTPSAVDAFMGDEPFPHDAIRSRLMKQGGVAYRTPGPESFPALNTVIEAITMCGALPCYPFLDGRSSGEQDMAGLLHDLLARGIVGLVVIPERNWHVEDPALRRDLIDRLHTTLDLAHDLEMPVFIGTEMNKSGQLLVDDLSVAPLSPYVNKFIQGADMLYAHTVLQQRHGLGFQSAWAQEWLPTRAERTRFYTALGQHLAPGSTRLDEIASRLATDGPQAILESL